jgi:hypothetical protein
MALLWFASPAQADGCRLALVLALDVSGSVDAREDRLQREGLARALLAPEVVRAFLSGDPVAVYVFEWSGPFSQVTMPPGWQMVETREDLVHIAANVEGRSWTGSESTNRTTAVGAALNYAAAALDLAPNCRARVVDISGNGVSNIGPNPQAIYATGRLDDVTVNALIIAEEHEHLGQLQAPAHDASLIAWFEAEVLRGPGAFSITAGGYGDYERAMRVKLERELQLPLVSGLPSRGLERPSG